MLLTASDVMRPLFSHADSQPILGFPIMIGTTAKLEAQQLAQTCPTARQEQVYYNALARFTVNHYCQCLGIETNIQATEFEDNFRRMLLDIVDIQLPGIGIIQCCPVLPGHQSVRIPAEAWENCVAHVAVEIDLQQHQAVLLGFYDRLSSNLMEEQNSEFVALDEFRGMDEFLDFLATTRPKLVELKHWWIDVFMAGWSSLEDLLKTSAPAHQPVSTLATAGAYRSSNIRELREKIEDFLGEQSLQASFRHGNASSKTNSISGYKLISFSEDSSTVALVLRAAEKRKDEYDIWIDAISGSQHEYLPQNLKLAILDSAHSELLVACTQYQNRHLQLEFSGSPGDSVILQISLNDLNFEEEIIL